MSATTPAPAPTPDPPAALATPPTAEAVIAQVQKWILQGADERDVAEAVAAAWPSIDARPAIAAAIDRIAEAAHFDPDLVAGFCLEATRELYRSMREIGDFTGALRAVRQLYDLSRALLRARAAAPPPAPPAVSAEPAAPPEPPRRPGRNRTTKGQAAED